MLIKAPKPKTKVNIITRTINNITIWINEAFQKLIFNINKYTPLAEQKLKSELIIVTNNSGAPTNDNKNIVGKLAAIDATNPRKTIAKDFPDGTSCFITHFAATLKIIVAIKKTRSARPTKTSRPVPRVLNKSFIIIFVKAKS
jgi:hypothetical protein